MSERDRIVEMDVALKRAEKFHGHLCPFLALGVRMSLIGIRELGAKGNNEDLQVTLMLENPSSYPCFIDGVQVTTECTINNKKLMLRALNNFSGIAVKFELPSKGEVTVAVNPTSFEALSSIMEKLVSENFPPDKFQQLVQRVISMSEEELFIVKRK